MMPPRKKTKKKSALDDVAPKKQSQVPEFDKSLRFPTGLTLLDEYLGGGFISGIVDIPGDSDAGKTLLAATTMASCHVNEATSHYKLIYNVTSESGINFNMKKLFNRKVAKAMTYVKTRTIEETLVDIGRLCESGEPFIYCIDSVDGLVSEAHLERVKAKIAGKAAKGTYGMERAKELSENLPSIKWEVKGNKSLVLLLQQTREKIGDAFVEKTKNGGKAPKFYADVEMWIDLKKANLQEEFVVNGKKVWLSMGTQSEIRIDKNHVSGFKGKIKFNVLLDYGIDDINCVTEFLFKYGALQMAGSYVACDDIFGKKMYKKDFLDAVEWDESGESWEKLIELLRDTIQLIKDTAVPKRKKRF